MRAILLMILCPMIIIISCSQETHHGELNNDTHITKIIVNSPEEALEELKQGNNRFLSGSLINTEYFEQIESSKEKQTPHSVILSCMDSRVPPEIIFDQGIGNIFVTRNAGNIEDANILGSMEYAIKFAGAKLIVVMGHSHCGAVKGAIQDVESGNLTQLVNQIKPAIPIESIEDNIEDATAKNSVRLTIQDILAMSETIKELHDSKQIMIVGAFYDIESGKVTFMD